MGFLEKVEAALSPEVKLFVKEKKGVTHVDFRKAHQMIDELKTMIPKSETDLDRMEKQFPEKVARIRQSLQKIDDLCKELRKEKQKSNLNLVKGGETKTATFTKKHRQLTYWTDSSTSTSIHCESADAAKKIIEKSGVEQELKSE